MKYFRILSYHFLFLLTIAVSAQNGDSIAIKIADKNDAVRVFQQSLFYNPANYLHFRNYTVTEFKFGKANSEDKASLAQYGQGQNSFDLSADAYHKQGRNKAMWGSAMYKQGKRKNVQWNESADYDKIFPYVVADSVGGAINYEHYRFEGGYTQQLGTYTIGISGFYQAQLEYRKIDPRPKNISAFFGLKIGGSKTINNKMVLGINGSIEKYTQKHKMSFYNPIGFPTIYQLSGMGNYNSLLKGKRKEAYYEGWTYGIDLQLYEAQKRNWFITGGIRVFDFEKIIPEFYDLQTSITKDTEYNLSIGKLFDFQKMTFGVLLDGWRKERSGTENLFVTQSSENYIKIGESERYNYQVNSAKISGLWKYDKMTNIYSMTPFLALEQTIEQYKTPFSKTDIQSIRYGLEGQWLHTLKNSAIISFNAGWTANTVAKEKANFNFSDSNAINQMLISNYKFQTADNWLTTLKLRYDFPIPKIINAFIGLDYTYQHYAFGNNNYLLGNIGITF